jgi:Predicted UDP-glucose 6-dehydrogenase
MKHIEAEIGKIAHNAFIASKVSFTNSIELISNVCNADPMQVMSTIWADRRVLTNAHLVPGLGGYAGKCIPKDTNELNAFQKEIGFNFGYFDEIESINQQVPPSVSISQTKIHVIVPTKQQDSLIKRALASLQSQSLLPDTVLIVFDTSLGLKEELKKIVRDFTTQNPLMNIYAISNNCTQNLSGAINAGLEYLKKDLHVSDSDFVSILDDDDYWDFRYLQNCISFALDVDCNWVVSGLIRHDSAHPAGIKQKIPESILQNDFFVGNPNIQGSNLFVKIGLLKKAGGFSEELDSTTDRDICIKLLDLDEIHIGYLRNHMVHHDCLSRKDRLSTAGSYRKQNGMKVFYEKYKSRMTADEISLFIDRAVNLFGVSPELFSNVAGVQ